MFSRTCATTILLLLFSSLGYAKDTLRIVNNSASTVYFVVQEETDTTTPIKRWVLTLEPKESGNLKLKDVNTDRVVVAYLHDKKKLKGVLAVTYVTKNNFYFGGDAVLFLENDGDHYFFVAPVFDKKEPPILKAGKPKELTKEDLDALIKQSNGKEFEENSAPKK